MILLKVLVFIPVSLDCLGATRTISVKKIANESYDTNSLKHDSNDCYNLNVELEDNSLFIMAGFIKKYFTHEILKILNV